MKVHVWRTVDGRFIVDTNKVWDRFLPFGFMPTEAAVVLGLVSQVLEYNCADGSEPWDGDPQSLTDAKLIAEFEIPGTVNADTEAA